MERYEIIIQDKRTKKPTNVSGEDDKNKKTNVSGQDEDDKKKEDEKESKTATIKLIAKTALTDAQSLIVPHIGELTRDSLLQRKIDDTISIIDTTIAFAIHPVYGFVNMATKTASRLLQYQLENEKEQNRLAVSLQRASYVNRSRD